MNQLRNLLPPDTVPQPYENEMTLLDLATHRSGLPMLPNNLHSTDPHNPLAFPDYGPSELYAFARGWGSRQTTRGLLWSSRFLGFRIARPDARKPRGSRLRESPRPHHGTARHARHDRRSLTRTASTVTPGLRRATPYQSGAVDLGALASGAGAIRSTAADMLRYLTANLHPETLSRMNDISAAIELQHKLQARIAPGASIALSWVYDEHNKIYQQDGGTAGYTCDAFFSPDDDYAVIVLTNIGPDLFQFASLLGEHIRERLTGQRALSLNTTVVPAGGGSLLDFVRTFAAWWITMLLSGAFIYCCVLGAQGVAAQLLPRRQFLRISSWMQLAAFAIFVAAYFLEPKIVTPAALIVPQSSAYLEWSPSYWFLGLFQQLKGSPALPELARRAWLAIAIAFGATASAYTLAYFRTMRRIVEEPDIAPALSGRNWLPRLGNGFATAIGQFSIRTMLRSRQHRLLLSLYLGASASPTIIFRKADESASNLGELVRLGPLCSTILIMLLCVLAIRVVFSLPMDLRANWIFRITPFPAGPGCMIARRRVLYILSVVPVCLVAGALLFSIWPWQIAAQHLVALSLLGSILAELALHGMQKLPFTCSYLPGKSNFNITFLLFGLLIFIVIIGAAQLERDSFDYWPGYAAIIGLLMALAICARWSASRLAKSPEGVLQFEEAADPAVFALDLHRDGVTPIEVSSAVTDK